MPPSISFSFYYLYTFCLKSLTFTATGEVDGPLEEEEEGRGCRKDGVTTGASEADSVDDSIGSSTEEPMPLVSPSVSTPGIICDRVSYILNCRNMGETIKSSCQCQED